jgi:hypothetical protein
MIPSVNDEVAAALRARWELVGEQLGDSWADVALRPVVEAAAKSEPLRRLFPFMSLNRQCFSRCSDYPYTLDCPCIEATSATYLVRSTWAVSDQPAPVLLETEDVDSAIGAAVGHLSAERSVWIGTRDAWPS